MMAYVRAMYTPRQIGELVRKKRGQFGIKLSDLAATLGLDERTLERIENGKKILTAHETAIISEFLEQSFEDLTSVQEDQELVVLHRRTGEDNEAAQNTIRMAQTIFHEMLSQSLVRGNHTYDQ